jgi:hypothetical protein
LPAPEQLVLEGVDETDDGMVWQGEATMPVLQRVTGVVALHWKRRFWDCPSIHCTGIVEA